MADAFTRVRDYLVEVALDGDGSELDGDTDLIDEEVLDSLGIFSMTEFLESAFSIEIDPEDVVIDNFETIDAICRLVASKQAAST